MDKNYYETLGISRNASTSEIADSFRRMSLLWHPKLSKQSQQTSSYHFGEVCQAYDVLSDPIKKAYYDKHGWRRLTQQMYSDAGLKGGYRYGRNQQQIYDKFFASTTALQQILDRGIAHHGSMFSHAFGGLNYRDTTASPDLVVEVPCSLSELYSGAAKKVKFEKKCLNPDGRSLQTQPVQKLLQIKPGFGKDTVLRFKQEGNESIERVITDLVFKITETPHSNYSRNNENLIYKATITLPQALKCQPLSITTLDGRKILASLDQIPNPHQLKQIQGQGMPIKNTNKKGNLYIKFDIIFPKSITEEAKIQLRKLIS